MTGSLINAARRLLDVLERENAALEAMDLQRAVALLPEKTAALAELNAFDPVARDPPEGSALLAAARRLDAIALENRTLLQRAITAQRRVIGIVARAVVAAVTTPSYGARGNRPGAGAPIALSTRA